MSQRPSSPAATVEQLLAGRPYRHLGRLGGGGQSSVHLLEHEIVLRRFVLKVLHFFHAHHSELVDRARVEAQAIAKLNHPNVVEVIDFWFGPNDTPCIVLELLEGHTLGHELEHGGPLPPARAIDVARQTLSALQAAHDIGVVHRDIKPDNLFLHHVPGRPTLVKVLDFGLARVLPDAKRAPAPLAVPTGTGVVVGSLRYMSPEGARGERVGPSADLFSVGVVLYAMLTGTTPAVPELARLDPPSRYADLSAFPGLDAIVARALAPTPAERHASAAEFRRELKRVLTA